MILFNMIADVNKFLEILAKIGIVAAYILIIMVTFGISVFIFWTIWFYPYVKKMRIDDDVKGQQEELDKIFVQKQTVTEETNELLQKNQDLLIEINNLKIERDKMRKMIEEVNKELDIAKKNIKKQKKENDDE